MTRREWAAPSVELGADSHVCCCCWSKVAMSVCCGAVEETGHLECVAMVRWNGMMTGGSRIDDDAAEKDRARVCWNMETGEDTRVAAVPLAKVRRHDRATGCGAVQHAENGNGWETDHLCNNTETSSREATDQAMIHRHHRHLTMRAVRQEARRIGLRWKLKRQTRVS